MEKKKGRPVLGGFAGLFFGLALAVLLLVFSVIRLDSIALVIIPMVLLLAGVVLGLVAPLAGSGADASGAGTSDPDPVPAIA